MVFFSLAALIVGIGLFESLSRGAWLGTVIGVAYLQYFKVQRWKSDPCGRSVLRSWRTGMHALVITFALLILAFWQLRFVEWQPARRVFSAANVNDFSWRNRVTAWTGAAQMMWNRPFFGYGWANAEALYNEKYRPSQIENGAAIQMNDYFMLGISAGAPALVCFLMYVGLSLRGSPSACVELRRGGQLPRGPDVGVGGEGRGAREQIELNCLQAMCRAAAIVLLVGFFFDGGLLKLATGSVFWILLELGRVDPSRVRHSLGVVEANNEESRTQRSDSPHPRHRWEVWLRRSAWVLGIAAVSESIILLSMPFFGVNNTTLAISRHYLVPPSAMADLNLLATNVDWSSRKLRPLLQHASLANYNRQLVNWKLDDQIYRDFVLNPLIDTARDGQLAWRRKLWEYFYLPIRRENDPASAARIVLKFLHQRIAIVPQGPVMIDEMWHEKQADARGIQAFEVAAFRSVGIPARLNESGRAELFSEGKWQATPEYIESAPESAEGKVK